MHVCGIDTQENLTDGHSALTKRKASRHLTLTKSQFAAHGLAIESVLAELIRDTLGAVVEVVDRLAVPPLVPLARRVVLASLVVESVSPGPKSRSFASEHAH